MAAGLAVRRRKADRRGQEDLPVGDGDRRAQRLADRLGEGQDLVRVALRHEDQAELVALDAGNAVARLHQARQPPGDRQQDGIADRDADRIVDLLVAVDVEHDDGRLHRHVLPREGERRLEAVHEQLAVGQAGEVVVDGVVQKPLLRGLLLGDVADRAHAAHDLAVGPDHRPRLQAQPDIVPVIGPDAEFLRDAAAPVIDDGVERSAETVAVEDVDEVEPAARRAVERAALHPEKRIRVGADIDAVGGHVPVPDDVAGARQGQGLALGVGQEPGREGTAGEGVLHHREADQHDDEDEAARQRRLDEVVRQVARDGEPGGDDPEEQQRPGRDQHHRTVITVDGKEHDDKEADEGECRDRDARHARRRRRVNDGEADERSEGDQPGGRYVAVAHMPSVEVQIGEEEDEQCRREDRLGPGAPRPVAVGLDREDLVQEPEIDGEVGQNRPGERRRGREHRRSLDDEGDRQEQREQPRNAHDDALVKGQRVDLVLVGVGIPEIELRQLGRAQLGDEGDARARVQGDAEDVGILANPRARDGIPGWA